MNPPDISQVAQPTNDLQYVIYAVALAVVLIILGLAWIKSKRPYDGEDRRVSNVEGNVERFAHVEKMISDLATQVAVLTVEVRTVNASLEKMETRFALLESRLMEHILDEERGRKK